MSAPSLTEAPPDLAPIAAGERIQALDVVRGFALIGIFLMNVEFFNRPLLEIGQGLPPGLSGIDLVAGWLVYVLVQGKFWTMFSLLFGMGFAVMLTRAERAGRDFFGPYLRRIAALAVFGALHHIFIWGGDILVSYAVAAVGLLILLYGRAGYVLAGLVGLVLLGFVPGLGGLQAFAVTLAYMGIAALFLRGEWTLGIAGRRMPVFALALLVIAAMLGLLAAALWAMPQAPPEARLPLTVVALALLVLGLLAARFHQPASARARRLGVAMYLLSFVMMTAFGAIQYYAPAAVPGADSPARQEWQAGHQRDIVDEARVMRSGTYAEAVQLRARDFARSAPEQAFFSTILVGVFLLGAWFVRSGVMEDTRAHLPLFRKLALFGLPAGLGLGLVSAAIATSATPGLERDPYLMAQGLMMIGNLPACLGYVAVVVLMLHGGRVSSRVAGLAPFGRMALTNYIVQSLLGTWFFYGYGLGHWGTGRGWQIVFVVVVLVLQWLFCRWWLERFRYGPLEWLWRAVTYWRLPPMRREPAGAGEGQVAARA